MTFMTSSNEILYIVIANNDKCQTIQMKNKTKIASLQNREREKNKPMDL